MNATKLFNDSTIVYLLLLLNQLTVSRLTADAAGVVDGNKSLDSGLDSVEHSSDNGQQLTSNLSTKTFQQPPQRRRRVKRGSFERQPGATECDIGWLIERNTARVPAYGALPVPVDKASTVDECKKACVDRPDCSGFTFSPNSESLQRCMLSPTMYNKGDAPSADYYYVVRPKASCPTACPIQWQTTPTLRTHGCDKASAATQETCQKKCEENELCTAINMEKKDGTEILCFLCDHNVYIGFRNDNDKIVQMSIVRPNCRGDKAAGSSPTGVADESSSSAIVIVVFLLLLVVAAGVGYLIYAKKKNQKKSEKADEDEKSDEKKAPLLSKSSAAKKTSTSDAATTSRSSSKSTLASGKASRTSSRTASTTTASKASNASLTSKDSVTAAAAATGKTSQQLLPTKTMSKAAKLSVKSKASLAAAAVPAGSPVKTAVTAQQTPNPPPATPGTGVLGAVDPQQQQMAGYPNSYYQGYGGAGYGGWGAGAGYGPGYGY